MSSRHSFYQPNCAQTAYAYDRDDWAAHTSPNKHVKLYVGSPASQAAGSYYVDAVQMGTIIAATQKTYSSFGGVMLWDAGNARGMCRILMSALRPRRRGVKL